MFKLNLSPSNGMVKLNTAHIKTLAELEKYLYQIRQFSTKNDKKKSKDKGEGKDASKTKDGLLRQPVPKLEDTLKTYMLSVRPLLSDEEFCNSCKIVKQFASKDGDGPKLQALLEERAKKMTNWMSCWWLHHAYLDFRNPVCVHSSPGLVFPSVVLKNDDERIKFASKMIRGTMEFKDMLDKKKFPQEKRGKILLDMSQYNAVFGTCRIPAVFRDTISYNPDSKHIVCIYKNNFFRVPVYDTSGCELLNEDQLEEQLKLVMSLDQEGDPVGILTTEERDNWGKAFALLMKDHHNQEVFKIIKSSLFTMSFDGPMPQSNDINAQTCAAKQFMHGGGSQYNSANRWYDKTIQFIIGEDGQNGLTYEHSPAEGQPVAVLTDFVIKYIEKNKKAKAAGDYDKTCHVNFNIDTDIQNRISIAKQHIDELVKETQAHGCKFHDYGSDFIKSNRLSPDSYIQMAFQLAFYRMHKKVGAQYESAAMRIYAQGRTETIRGCSIESQAMARTMLNHRTTLEERMKSLLAAVNGHRNYTMKAVEGLGCDRHLFGLRMIANEKEMLLPRIFSDVAFTRSSHMRISTSQVAAKCDAFMVYGPVVTDGYACCYNPRPKDMNFGITTFASHPTTSPERWRVALEESLLIMHNTCVQFAKKYPPKKDDKKKKK